MGSLEALIAICSYLGWSFTTLCSGCQGWMQCPITCHPLPAPEPVATATLCALHANLARGGNVKQYSRILTYLKEGNWDVALLQHTLIVFSSPSLKMRNGQEVGLIKVSYILVNEIRNMARSPTSRGEEHREKMCYPKYLILRAR